ncbi:cytochrome c peroxidase [Maribacter vaceletii]|uniref:Cytochrome c peroxidase n=1 Tax=Maribacter vaceletii TaxID=1206816 RepID=A0A495E8N8_9FLAO|nr:cytochrome c peroxidase [Maribacter vaceletii]RKR12167.1 cytochrome c peroxidase [Maribacter vaceletii]
MVIPIGVYGQKTTKPKVEELREILSPYFVPFSYDTNFLKEEKDKIDLGRALFFETQISEKSTISCNSCHDLKKGGTNGAHYLDLKEEGVFYRDVPSVYNVASLSLYNADGGEKSFKKKIEDTFATSHEMGVINESVFVDRLKENKKYTLLFSTAYPSGKISFENAVNALQMFIKGLVTPAPIDVFISGDNKAFSEAQVEGGLVFNALNCYTCHTGSNLGGQMIQKLGIAHDWPNQEDLGYYRLNKNPDYKMFFRVAPLRNVEITSPYFHDASSKKIWKAIQQMGKHERGIQVSIEDALKIKEFLKTLTGKVDANYIEPN